MQSVSSKIISTLRLGDSLTLFTDLYKHIHEDFDLCISGRFLLNSAKCASKLYEFHLPAKIEIDACAT